MSKNNMKQKNNLTKKNMFEKLKEKKWKFKRQKI